MTAPSAKTMIANLTRRLGTPGPRKRHRIDPKYVADILEEDFRPHNPKQLQAVMTKTAEIPTTPLSPAARTLATPCAPLSAEDRRRYERELDAGARRQLTELQSAARRTAGTFAARAAATREPGAQAAARAIEGLCRAVADALAMAGRVPATTKEETK